jgi:nucleotide-binding universal stress UspA family protein
MPRGMRILGPTDFSPCADVAIDLAADLDRDSGATLLLLLATEPPGNLGSGAMNVPNLRRARAFRLANAQPRQWGDDRAATRPCAGRAAQSAICACSRPRAPCCRGPSSGRRER